RMQPFDFDGVEAVVDVGHNPQAAREGAACLRAHPAAGRTVAVYAALADEDVAGVGDAPDGGVDRWYLAGLGAVARGLGPDALGERLAGTAAAGAALHPDVAAALLAARADATAGDRIVVLGSFHTAAAALALLQGRH